MTVGQLLEHLTGAGGACVLSDCVPSKTFIASSEVVTGYRHNERFGIRSAALEGVEVDAVAVHDRVKKLALAQSGDIQAKLIKAGVDVVTGRHCVPQAFEHHHPDPFAGHETVGPLVEGVALSAG